MSFRGVECEMLEMYFDFTDNTAYCSLRELDSKVKLLVPPNMLALSMNVNALADINEPVGGARLVFFGYSSLKRCLQSISHIGKRGRITFNGVVSAKPETRRAFGIDSRPNASYKLNGDIHDKLNTSAWDCVLGSTWDRIAHNSVVIYAMHVSEGSFCHSLHRVIRVSIDFTKGLYDFPDYRQHVIENILINKNVHGYAS